MHRYFSFFLMLFLILLSSCTGVPPATTPGSPTNRAEYAAPTYTPRPIPTPLPKSQNGEITLLLRRQLAPYEEVILRLPNNCLMSGEECNTNGNFLGILPQSLSQNLKIYWTNNGDKAFFWDDNTTDIYILDGTQGTFQVFKKDVLKVRNNFLISPNGENSIFEIQKSAYETDLVSMDNSSGDISKFDIPVTGAKYASQWINDHTFLFWDEINDGKGYLADRKVYIFNIIDHSVQPFDIEHDWIKTSVPVFSPNKNFMAFTTENQTIIRDASRAVENTWAVGSEKLLWSGDSSQLAIYDSNGEIYTVSPTGGDLQEIYSLSSIGSLEDWIWLPDNNHILLIAVDVDGNRKIGILSLAEKIFSPLNLSLLNQYDPVSFSFRP